MRGVNKVMLIGNLGREPEISYTDEGVCNAKFQLATTETYNDRAGKLNSHTEWHNVMLWRGLAELAHKYLHKGSLVFIEGRLRTRAWEEKTGGKRFFTEVVGENMIMLDKRGEGTLPAFQPDAAEPPYVSHQEAPPQDPTDPDFLSF
jgi:single-strand DNA-binding protein